MAGSQIIIRDTKLEKGLIGLNRISLTEWGTTAESAIAAGSVVEVAGSLYSFSTDETIEGDTKISDGTEGYIIVGTDTDSLLQAEYSTEDPSTMWSDAKQGYYSTGNERYVAGVAKSTDGAWEDEYILSKRQKGTLPFSKMKAYTTAGSYSFKVPFGIYRIYGIVIGQGGDGGNVTSDGTVARVAGGGGGAGGRAEAFIDVSPGEIVTINVGAGGTASASGGDTNIVYNTITYCQSSGGLNATSKNATGGGDNIGQAARGGVGEIGIIKKAGSAGGFGAIEDIRVWGGMGADGPSGIWAFSGFETVGNDGTAPGSGGGGAAAWKANASSAGGSGADGSVYILY